MDPVSRVAHDGEHRLPWTWRENRHPSVVLEMTIEVHAEERESREEARLRLRQGLLAKPPV